MKNISTYIFLLFYILILACIFFISGLSVMIQFMLSICIYGGLFYILHLFWKKIRKKEKLNLASYGIYFLQKIAGALSCVILLMGGFGIYHNIIAPAKFQLYTLSNGEKTIQFQTMSHIASEEFYERVQRNIIRSKNNDYVLYFEGVQAGTSENIEAFNKALGIEFEAGIYENFSKLYGVVAQNNDDFLGLINNKDYNIDMSIDEIMEIYNSYTKNDNKNEDREVFNMNEEVIKTLASLKPKELQILRFINQSFLNFIMKNEAFRNTIIETVGNTNLFSVILDDRNIHIVEQIYTRDDEKIFILYGLMHFDGILKLLQAKDPRWKIQEVQEFQVIHSW